MLGRSLLPAALLLLVPVAGSPAAQAPGDEPPGAGAGGGDDQALVEALQNPVADLMSFPFQNNFEFGIGPGDDFRYVLNFQPVIPVQLGPRWNLISRTIVPLVAQPELVPGTGSAFGLGDVLESLFLSPAGATGVTWGVGPVLLFPTATDRQLGAEKWGAGPTAVLLSQARGWTYGILANHVWSFAGEDRRPDVSVTFLQPFLSLALPGGKSVAVQTEATFDWEREQWTVPLQLALGQLAKLGRLPVNLQVGGRWWAEGPALAPDWSLRLTATFLVPTGR